MNWKQKFNDTKNYMLEGCTADYIESIDRDQAVFYGKALYDYYRLINNDTLEQEIVTAEQMEAFAKAW